MRIVLLVVLQSLALGTLAFWAASRSRRVLRVVGGAVALFLLFDSLISLVDLFLIHDALPGGIPTPTDMDPTRVQAVAEYGAATLVLLVGWVTGSRHRRFAGRAQSSVPPEADS